MISVLLRIFFYLLVNEADGTIVVRGPAAVLTLAGSIRMIRSEPSFTPYYALIGEDAARLSYLAEVALGKDAARLPAGLPLRVEFDGR